MGAILGFESSIAGSGSALSESSGSICSRFASEFHRLIAIAEYLSSCCGYLANSMLSDCLSESSCPYKS